MKQDPGAHCEDQVDLNSQRPTCLCIPKCWEFKGMHYHARLRNIFLNN